MQSEHHGITNTEKTGYMEEIIRISKEVVINFKIFNSSFNPNDCLTSSQRSTPTSSQTRFDLRDHYLEIDTFYDHHDTARNDDIWTHHVRENCHRKLQHVLQFLSDKFVTSFWKLMKSKPCIQWPLIYCQKQMRRKPDSRKMQCRLWDVKVEKSHANCTLFRRCDEWIQKKCHVLHDG